MPFLRAQNSAPSAPLRTLTAENLGFQTFWDANVAILAPKPGCGILLACPHDPAIKEINFMVGGEIYAASVDDDGRIAVEEMSCIDPRGWEFDGEAWVADQLNNPTLVEVTFKAFGNVEDLFFVHEDFEIRNPTISECGRFSVAPSEYGFVHRADDESNWYRAVTKGTLVLTKFQLVLMDALGEIIAVRDLSDIRMANDE
ncbi:hypothetical protein ACQCLI_31795 (plasmid) [Pseudomonas nitroreducens]|uniref:hypothetical protein n=1 Tax=Pseudomonas nitroreducens TaxID=46680 RepID=UPI00036140EE|nr:hypothetical protein [Pseudomonas nitroreducens]